MKKNGFTLIETLVAIFILTTAIAAALTAAGSGLQSSFYARDQITAFYLGEEAVEYIRNIRDTNFINRDANWLDHIPSGCFTSLPNGCRVDALNKEFIDTATGQNNLILHLKKDTVNPENNAYSYDQSAPLSKFTRTISIQKIDSQTTPQEILVTVTMSWGNGSFGTRSFTLQEQLFNWAPQDTL